MSKQTAIIVATDNGYAVQVDGVIIRDGFVNQAIAASWASRKGLYKGRTRRRKTEIPEALEGEQIVRLPLGSRITGVGYPRFLDECKRGLWGELYQIGKKTFGLKLGNIRRGMAARAVQPVK